VTIEGLVEIAHKMSAGRRGDVIALELLHVDVGDDVGVQEGAHDIHLLSFEIMVIGKRKENTKNSISNSRGKDRGIIKILHVAASDKMSHVFNTGSRTLALDLALSRASNDARMGEKEGQGARCL
jgi:hypothetical protein